MDAATLEWSIRHLEGMTYTVDTRFWPAGSTSDAQLVPGALPRIELDSLALLPLLSDPQAYGAALTSRLFADERLRIAFRSARTSAETDAVPLRVLLRLDASDSTIHGLAWETLQDVERGGFLFQSERVLLARMLDSPDLTPLTPRPRGTVRALIVVAHPSGLEDYGLAPIDVTGEIARCRLALGDIPLTVLARESTHQAANLTNLRAALRDEPDILYLAAHGTHRDGQPYLWLEHDDGTIDRVAGNEFARSLAQLPRQPLLVVLASCQSGGQSHDAGALAAVGPLLAVAGVGAVLGMQGNVTMDTVAGGMPVFFQELLRDGQIERAVAAARAAVQSRFDWWLPVLWLRLRDGRLWAAPAASPTGAPSGQTIINQAPNQGMQGIFNAPVYFGTPPPTPHSSPASASASQEEITQQQERLKMWRGQLHDLLTQMAKLGSAWAPPGVSGAIREARAEIAKIKATLRTWGVVEPDHPDDIP